MSSETRVLIGHRAPIDERVVVGLEARVRVERDPNRWPALLTEEQPDAFIMELQDATTGLNDLAVALAVAPNTVHIVAVNPNAISLAAEAMEKGAHGFVLSPLSAKAVNVVLEREIEHVRTARECARLRAKDFGGIPVPGSTLDEIEKQAILRSLAASGGSTGKAAKMLGISVRKIQYRLREWQESNPELFERRGNRIVVTKPKKLESA